MTHREQTQQFVANSVGKESAEQAMNSYYEIACQSFRSHIDVARVIIDWWEWEQVPEP